MFVRKAYNSAQEAVEGKGSALDMVSSYIAWYLFLAGAGGGAFLIGSFVDFRLRMGDCARLRQASFVTDPGLLAGPALVALGSVFLFLDLGAPDQAFRLFFMPSGSLISVGAWALALFCLAGFASFALGLVDDGPAAQVLETALSIVSTGLALFVVVYAGVFLSLYPAVPFLNTPLIPVLFVASALATGAAVLIVIGFFRSARDEDAEGLDSLLKVDMALVAVEALALAAFLAASLLGGGSAARSASELLAGNASMLFWLGVVVAGLVLPLSVDAVCLRFPRSTVLVVGAASTLMGGVCLRFALLIAAQRFCLVDMSALAFWA